ncbi:MAG: hypothetical protein MRQ11_05345 [Candidatus Midichloria mitochondrii]|nr:hypothetical protein [Candidatus Midichloria mitochondrii]
MTSVFTYKNTCAFIEIRYDHLGIGLKQQTTTIQPNLMLGEKLVKFIELYCRPCYDTFNPKSFYSTSLWGFYINGSTGYPMRLGIAIGGDVNCDGFTI